MPVHNITFYESYALQNPGSVLYMFLLVGFIDPLKNVWSLIWRRHHYQWMEANFGLDCFAFIAIELLFSVPHTLWHGESVYNGYLPQLLSV